MYRQGKGWRWCPGRSIGRLQAVRCHCGMCRARRQQRGCSAYHGRRTFHSQGNLGSNKRSELYRLDFIYLILRMVSSFHIKRTLNVLVHPVLLTWWVFTNRLRIVKTKTSCHSTNALRIRMLLFGQEVVCLNMDLLLSYLNLQTRGKGMPLNTRLGMWSNYNLTNRRLYIEEWRV